MTEQQDFPAAPTLLGHQPRRRMARLGTILAASLTALALAGCSLPRGAALQSEVLRGTGTPESTVQVVEVTRDNVGALLDWPAANPAMRHSWPGAGAAATALVIRAGDMINVSVWDSQPDSLLTTGEARSVRMEAMPVSSQGTVFIPYVGEVRIAGMTASQARREIQDRLTPIVPDGQVQLSVQAGTRNTIDVVSGVARPGRVQLPEISPTILSVLSETGGIASNLRNPLVRLFRAGVGYAIPARTLFSNPGADIQLRGGDRVVVEEDQRNFIALGATGREQVIYFEREDISALDAISTAGGLSDSRANLQGVMVLRVYPEGALRQDDTGPGKSEVVFTFDLTGADGLFAAQRFLIEPGDVVLATESSAPLVAHVANLLRIARNLPS